jgi:signal transduction histidine kinase
MTHERDDRDPGPLDSVEVGGALLHELGNALFALSSELEALGAELGVDTEHPLLRAARASQWRMAALVDDYRALVRPDAPHLVDRDVTGVVSAALEAIPARGGEAPRLVAPDAPLRVRCDPDVLTPALTTLLIAAGALRARARVTIEPQGDDRVKITLRGPGIGLDAERLFRPFEARIPGGTKLSLAVAAQAVIAHRGQVRATNGKSMKVEVTLTTLR